MSNKTYLGDAVYGEWQEHENGFVELILTTEDGIRATNRIVLEPTVIMALEGFLAARRALVKAKAETQAERGLEGGHTDDAVHYKTEAPRDQEESTND